MHCARDIRVKSVFRAKCLTGVPNPSADSSVRSSHRVTGPHCQVRQIALPALLSQTSTAFP